jgi:hypothetical protein
MQAGPPHSQCRENSGLPFTIVLIPGFRPLGSYLPELLGPFIAGLIGFIERISDPAYLFPYLYQQLQQTLSRSRKPNRILRKNQNPESEKTNPNPRKELNQILRKNQNPKSEKNDPNHYPILKKDRQSQDYVKTFNPSK